ncbi:MAG: hypothetical protein QGI10_12725 [Vicinamibacterales bacterium]|mgnify:FL=1|jgi:hypothetical protein|nr:hypothetical protein [Vicinamibacterales bacterium]HJN45520.1 hypothetical protein [Vicinamibacterales bacterium]|tara:strand:+ start:226 stop:543 length:318 start_codon:yes stop_codon:yes gene_type:complete
MHRFLTAIAVLAATLALMFFFTSRLESNLGTVVFARRGVPDAVSYLSHWHASADRLPRVEALFEQIRVAARTWIEAVQSGQDDPPAANHDEDADTTTRNPMMPAL